MRSFPPGTWANLLKLIHDGVYSWCVAIEAAPGEAFFLTPHKSDITFAGKTWHAFPMTVGPFVDDGSGDLTSTSITLSNIGRLPMPYLESMAWDQGKVQLILVYTQDPDGPPPPIRLAYQMQSPTSTHEVVTLNLGQGNLIAVQFPPKKYIRDMGFPGILRNTA